MAGLTRREFLAGTAALAAASGIAPDRLAVALQEPAVDLAAIPSTLQQTILHGPVVKGRYRSLTTAPGG